MSGPLLVSKSYARVGLLGNPSDGFGGKTLSLLLGNFCATVTLRPHECVVLEPHPEYDATFFRDLSRLGAYHGERGYYGGLRLLQATCKMFAQVCDNAGLTVHKEKGFIMSYETTIPRMVGLSGSSAIVVAAFRGLLTYCGLTLDDIKVTKSQLPQLILDVEKKELDIAAGLQDRVIQVYGGVVHMDFSPTDATTSTTTSSSTSHDYADPSKSAGKYTSIDSNLLPPLYLAYNVKVGGESGKVHSTVKERWAYKDPELVAGMKELGSLADSGVDCLKRGDIKEFASLMDRNFAIRRKLYGDDVVGSLNIKASEVAAGFGLSAKFTGSGGAFVCCKKDGSGWLSPEDESSAVEKFGEVGFSFIRIQVALC